ncbi:MAG: type II toxin-antitoxin system VapC family toxin [Candidatus Competibacteraceae bacterium]
MSSRAVDTNVLLRYLTADDPEQSPIAGRLINRPEENADDFLVTIPVVCELTWLLRSRRYGFDRGQIADAWEWLLGSSRFRFQMRAQIAQAVATFRTGTADLSDYLILYLARHEGVSEGMTFDRDFAAMEGVTLLGNES